jgi:hypothetical protein
MRPPGLCGVNRAFWGAWRSFLSLPLVGSRRAKLALGVAGRRPVGWGIPGEVFQAAQLRLPLLIGHLDFIQVHVRGSVPWWCMQEWLHPLEASMSANTAPDLAEQIQGKKKRRTARVLLWATVWATVLSGLLMVNFAPRALSEQAAIEAAIAKSEDAIRPTLPKKIDELTTMVAIRHAGSKVQFDAVVDLSKAASRPTASFASQMRALVLPKVCNSEMVQSLRIGVSYEYVYRDQKSNDLGSFIISNSDCQSLSK